MVVVAACIAAGFWQINRLGERQDQNALASARMDTPISLGDARAVPAAELEFTRVQLTGTFDPDGEILIANRSRDGAAGFWVWTNFETGEGDLLVSRGFVNRGTVIGIEGAPPFFEAAPTTGTVVIEGLMRSGFDNARVSSDRTQLTRPDAAQAAEVLGLDPAFDERFYLSVLGQDPARTQEIPFPVPLPDLGEGPHRSYAFQWFTFATIGVIGYGVVLYRIARGDQRRGDVPLSQHV